MDSDPTEEPSGAGTFKECSIREDCSMMWRKNACGCGKGACAAGINEAEGTAPGPILAVGFGRSPPFEGLGRGAAGGVGEVGWYVRV